MLHFVVRYASCNVQRVWHRQGDGAWEPRDPACKSPSQKGSGLKAGSDGDSEDGDLPDEEPAPETPAVKRAASATAARDLKPPVSGGKPVKAEVAASSRGLAAGKPGAVAAWARSSAGDGAVAVSSRAPAAVKAVLPEGSERTRAGMKPKVRSSALIALFARPSTSWRAGSGCRRERLELANMCLTHPGWGHTIRASRELIRLSGRAA